MYERYKAPFGARLWSNMVWYSKRFYKAFPDVLAGLGLAAMLVLLPIMTAFAIG